MSVQIRLAKTPVEQDAVYRLRKRAFTSCGAVLNGGDAEHYFDHIDAFPTTVNIIAEEDGNIVGNLRLTAAEGDYVPTDDIFNFHDIMPASTGKSVSANLFCLDPAHADNDRLITGIYLLGFYWSLSRQASHITLLAPPTVAKQLALLGCKIVAPSFKRADTSETVMPMLLETRRANDFFYDYVKRQRINPYLENFRRECFNEGEIIIRQGDEGHAAYVIVDGLVTVTVGKINSPEEKVLCELGPGEMVGEIALLTSAARTANVVAFTDVDVMVLDKDDFEASAKKYPEHFLAMLKTVGLRLKSTLERGNPRSPS